MNRRHFLQLLGIAPLAFDPHRAYFDMGRKLWLPEPIDIPSILNQLNKVTPQTVETIFSGYGFVPLVPWLTICTSSGLCNIPPNNFTFPKTLTSTRCLSNRSTSTTST